jgi:hypothetical protein
MLTKPISMGIIAKPEWNLWVSGDFEPLVDRETCPVSIFLQRVFLGPAQIVFNLWQVTSYLLKES